MTAITIAAAITWLIAIAAFVPLLIRGSGSGDLPPWLFVAVGTFGAMSVVWLFLLMAYMEDMARLGFSTEQKNRWRIFLLASGPVAVAIYWRRYVRSGEPTTAG